MWNVLVIGIFLAVVLFAKAGFGQSLNERECKPAVNGKGVSYVQQVAKRDSVHNWLAKVRKLHGDDWANYSAAKVKRFPCNRAGWFTKSCAVVAQPCRDVQG